MRTLSRRALLGGGAVAVGGAGAHAVGETTRGRRWLHNIGLVDGPDEAIPDLDVPVQRRRLRSTAMGADVPWGLALPPTSEPAGIVVCLHGRNQGWPFAFDDIGVHRFAADEHLPLVVVAPDGGKASYWHARSDGTDALAMVLDELVPAVRQEVGDLPVALLGWSMGGYGALLGGVRSDEIAAITAGSPAVWRRFADAAPGAFDDADDFHRHSLFARVDRLAGRPVRIDCGDDDPFSSLDRELAAAIPGSVATFGDGFHDDAFWRSRARAQLQFLHDALVTNDG